MIAFKLKFYKLSFTSAAKSLYEPLYILSLKECLESSKLNKEDIYSVEIVGGSSRIPTKTTLTPEIINLPQVQSKILTPAESEMDNCPITVKELSHALDWMDRYSYPVLKCFEHKVLEKITSQSLKA